MTKQRGRSVVAFTGVVDTHRRIYHASFRCHPDFAGHPWESIDRYLRKIVFLERSTGFAYISVGERA